VKIDSKPSFNHNNRLKGSWQQAKHGSFLSANQESGKNDYRATYSPKITNNKTALKGIA
jgi:hypothetical protein